MEGKVYKVFILLSIMESKAGSVLTFIGGIFTLVGAGIFLIISLIIWSLTGLSDMIREGWSLELV